MADKCYNCENQKAIAVSDEQPVACEDCPAEDIGDEVCEACEITYSWERGSANVLGETNNADE